MPVKQKFYMTVVKLAMVFGFECWVINGKEELKIKVADMKMLRWICNVIRLDKIRN